MWSFCRCSAEEMPSRTDFRYVPLYSLQPSRVPLLLLQGLHITLLFISHMMKINSFSITQGLKKFLEIFGYRGVL